MSRNTRPDDFENDAQPAEGPLTQLINEHAEQRPQAPRDNGLPRPPEAKPTGREDYASGTAEHDDDREI